MLKYSSKVFKILPKKKKKTKQKIEKLETKRD